MIENILNEIQIERIYQIDKWGKEADDKVNRPMDFVGYIAHHSSRWFDGGFSPYSRETLIKYRQQMIKVAALAVAAIEAIDKILSGENYRADILENID